MVGTPAEEIHFQIGLNGSPIQGLMHASIVSTNCFSSDTFSLTFTMGSFPLCDVIFWSSLTSGYIEIAVLCEFGLLPEGLISGMIDSIVVDPIQGTVTVEGRDLSSSMIDAYRQQDFVNQTASEVASAVAIHHGLTPVVTPTTSSVGRYYGDGYTRLSLGQFSRLRTDWDLVVQLARENSFDVFVQGSNLFFQPSLSAMRVPVHVALRDVRTMRFERTLPVSSGTTARVQSWNSQNMSSYASNGSTDATPEASKTNPQPFLFSASNFTSQQVTESADRYAAELSRLGVLLHIEMPWDLTLSPRTKILVDETNSIFDSTYRIDNIERHYSMMGGSSQIIRATVI